MVYLPLSKKFVPAQDVQVGDALLLLGETSVTTTRIHSIRTVSRRGAFAPFTKSGTIVVNGVVASNYIAYNDCWGVAQQQFLAHSYATLVRHLSSYYGKETYTEQGISTWYALPHRLLTTNQNMSSSWWRQGLAMVGIGGIVVVASLVRFVEEKHFHLTVVWLVVGGAGLLWCSRRRSIGKKV